MCLMFCTEDREWVHGKSDLEEPSLSRHLAQVVDKVGTDLARHVGSQAPRQANDEIPLCAHALREKGFHESRVTRQVQG